MTAAEKIESKLGTMQNCQIEETYRSIFRMWTSGGKVDLALSGLMRVIEDAMDERGMDTDAIIDGLMA